MCMNPAEAIRCALGVSGMPLRPFATKDINPLLFRGLDQSHASSTCRPKVIDSF